MRGRGFRTWSLFGQEAGGDPRALSLIHATPVFWLKSSQAPLHRLLLGGGGRPFGREGGPPQIGGSRPVTFPDKIYDRPLKCAEMAHFMVRHCPDVGLGKSGVASALAFVRRRPSLGLALYWLRALFADLIIPLHHRPSGRKADSWSGPHFFNWPWALVLAVFRVRGPCPVNCAKDLWRLGRPLRGIFLAGCFGQPRVHAGGWTHFRLGGRADP